MPNLGGPISSRPLHFIWIADCSGSMVEKGKIQALNNAIRETLPHMQTTADQNPNARVLLRAVRFASGAQWHVSQPTPLADFRWSDLPAGGVTDMGKALSIVAEQLRIPPMEERALPPVLVLLSDGHPTDDFRSGRQALMNERWGQKAVRLAIAIGDDADHGVLQEFIGHPEIQPFQANNPEQLAQHIRWVSTAVLQAASAPPSQTPGAPALGNVQIPMPVAATSAPSSAGHVW